jgi:TRAP-type mannitol/chloroaromatic compound transport system permease small subunit
MRFQRKHPPEFISAYSLGHWLAGNISIVRTSLLKRRVLLKRRSCMQGFIRRVDQINEWIGKVLLWLPWMITAIIIWEVVGRYFFNKPTIWAHELSLMVFGALSMVGGAYAHKYRAHVNMDLFYARLSPKGKAILDLITFPFFLIFCGVILWKGWEFAWRSIIIWEYSQSNWEPLLWPIKLTIPVGALLLILQGLSNLISDLAKVYSRKGVKN